MITKLTQIILALSLSACMANSLHRPLVPTTSTDHLDDRGEQTRAGEIGDKLCENLNGQKPSELCSVQVEYDQTGEYVVPKYKLLLLRLTNKGDFTTTDSSNPSWIT